MNHPLWTSAGPLEPLEQTRAMIRISTLLATAESPDVMFHPVYSPDLPLLDNDCIHRFISMRNAAMDIFIEYFFSFCRIFSMW